MGSRRTSGAAGGRAEMAYELPPGTRCFSLEEASRMLPLVRRIVEDIAAQWRAMEPGVARFQALPEAERRSAAGRAAQEELQAGAAALDGLVAELQELGCHFKGFEDGLVDWYSLYADRPVFLCWKLGEPEIGWWHQVDAGFIGRQPILESQRDAFRGNE